MSITHAAYAMHCPVRGTGHPGGMASSWRMCSEKICPSKAFPKAPICLGEMGGRLGRLPLPIYRYARAPSTRTPIPLTRVPGGSTVVACTVYVLYTVRPTKAHVPDAFTNLSDLACKRLLAFTKPSHSLMSTCARSSCRSPASVTFY